MDLNRGPSAYQPNALPLIPHEPWSVFSQFCQFVLLADAGLSVSVVSSRRFDCQFVWWTDHRFVSLCREQTQICQFVLSADTGLSVCVVSGHGFDCQCQSVIWTDYRFVSLCCGLTQV